MAYVELRHLGKQYGALRVIHDLDLAINEGEFCALLGPSGCGKSTLLRMIAGLETVTNGTVTIGGRDVTQVPPAKRKISMVFQSYALYPHMSVRQNIGFSLDIAGETKAAIAQKVDATASLLQLTPYLDRRPAQLSGGQRQRVAIGRALVREPEVFLFDEPLSNLDAKLRVQMRLELAKLHHDLKTTMIYVTHDQIEAMTLADRIVVLDAGRIAQVGTPLDLFARPDNKFVAAFIGSPGMNFLTVTPARQDGRKMTVTLPGGHNMELTLRSPGTNLQGPVELGIRPEHTRPVAPDAQDAHLVGTISMVERLGNMTVLYVDTPAGNIIVGDTSETMRALGDLVGLQLDPTRSHIFAANGQVV